MKQSSFTRRAIAVLAPLGLGLGAAVPAHNAELPAAVATAVNADQTNMTTAIGLVIAAMVVVWGLMKLGRKLGWI